MAGKQGRSKEGDAGGELNHTSWTQKEFLQKIKYKQRI